jgi:hypothetical protein
MALLTAEWKPPPHVVTCYRMALLRAKSSLLPPLSKCREVGGEELQGHVGGRVVQGGERG